MVHRVLRLFLASLCLLLLASHAVNGRYLPTRSNEDSLDKLRDLLRDILDSDKPSGLHQGSHGPSSFYGNDAGADRYPFGGPKFLSKRDAGNGWENWYNNPMGPQQPLH